MSVGRTCRARASGRHSGRVFDGSKPASFEVSGSAELAEVDALVRGLAERDGEGNDRLAALAVAWVLRNSQPMKLEKPDYRR